MLEVQKYLKEKGLEALIKEFNIKVTDYPDRIVLNYDQIESPRFHPIVDECRALILKKDENWGVLANSFRRFYNYLEGYDVSLKVENPVRVTSYEGQKVLSLPINTAKIFTKIDGSLISYYFDGEKFCCSTRSMAFAEGSTNMGRTFAQLFDEAAKKTGLYKMSGYALDQMKKYTFVFELTSPESRVTTPFTETKITLLAVRSNKEEDNYKELPYDEVQNAAMILSVDIPKSHTVTSYSHLLETVSKFHCMDEGVVLVWETNDGSFYRVKCKNPSFVAIANMRGNGAISPKRILTLVMKNEQEEYLQYFSEDLPYFTFVTNEYNAVKVRLNAIYTEYKDLTVQKDFALAIKAKVKYSFEQGVLFSARKTGMAIDDILKESGPEKIAKGMDLRGLFAKQFKVVTEEEP